ncbi:MAG: hypothetical protein H7Y86_22175 [Rhizobacter sp.]|nr:hypothetical protein [Ferruginibacter sp.]
MKLFILVIICAYALVTASNSVQLGEAFTSKVKTAGDIFVHYNKGLIISNDAAQQKKITTTVAVNVTIPAKGLAKKNFSFPEAFSAAPMCMWAM